MAIPKLSADDEVIFENYSFVFSGGVGLDWVARLGLCLLGSLHLLKLVSPGGLKRKMFCLLISLPPPPMTLFFRFFATCNQTTWPSARVGRNIWVSSCTKFATFILKISNKSGGYIPLLLRSPLDPFPHLHRGEMTRGFLDRFYCFSGWCEDIVVEISVMETSSVYNQGHGIN